MKLPFNKLLNPVMKPYFKESIVLCENPIFSLSLFYIYFYGTVGFFLNVNHLRKHLGEVPDDKHHVMSEMMVLHDLNIIATSMGVIQYACLLVGCSTENPALFLPHLAWQPLVAFVKILNVFLQLTHLNLKTFGRNIFFNDTLETSEGGRMKLRALLVALLGVSMSACAFAAQPVELELDDEHVAQKLNNVSFARRITKPTIRMVMGYGKLSAFITAATSLLLLVAVMSKATFGLIGQQSWWRRGARWLAAPALLVAALEVASDAGDHILAAVLRGSSNPFKVAVDTVAAALLITVEILVWYFIAKFFEHNPTESQGDNEKENIMIEFEH